MGAHRPREGLFLIAALVACSCSGSSSTDESTAAPTTTETATTAPSETAPRRTTTTSSIPDLSDAADDVSGALGFSMGTGEFGEPNEKCIDRAFGELPVRGRQALQIVEEDPLAWETLEGDDAFLVASAYVGCLDQNVLRNLVTISTLRVVDELACVNAAWTGLLTPEMVASSLAYGDALDDLAPEDVEELAAAAAACVPDRQWWIDDVAFRLEDDMTAADAECVAIAYVDVLGVDEVIRRRLLTIPLLAVPPENQGRLDLTLRCGIDAPVPLPELRAEPGACLTGFGSGTAATAVIACAERHNAEVVSVHDLATTFPAWPGAQELRTEAGERCRSDVEALPGSTAGYTSGWDLPSRATWEQAWRTLTCTLVRPEFEPWTGSSGQLPTPEPPQSTVPANVGQEVLDLDSVAVGTCMFRAPGASDEDRAMFIADCASPHHEEVFHVFDLDAAADAPFPGDEATAALAEAGCDAAFEPYVGVPYAQSRLFYSYYPPDQTLWEEMRRKVQCVLHAENPDEPITGSKAGSRE